MKKNKRVEHTANQTSGSVPEVGRIFHGSIVPAPDTDKYLDSVQLHRLEQTFRDWAEAASRPDVRASRRRILLIFLLIRYTGAKLSEVLRLQPLRDMDFEGQYVHFGRWRGNSGRLQRKVQLSEALCDEIQAIISHSSFARGPQDMLKVDPGFVRRKFYERAEACGIAKQLGAPEILRRSRAVELMQNNMPLPAVQMLLGHSTPNLTSAYVSFSEEDIQQATRFFMEKESSRKTSARNAFFGKIQAIRQGDIQARVDLLTTGGYCITTVITSDSLQRLGLKVGKLITAEVKAPWIILYKAAGGLKCSADNVLGGVVERITRGAVNTEYVVRISDGTEVCAIITSESGSRLGLGQGDEVLVAFNGYAVVLQSQ